MIKLRYPLRLLFAYISRFKGLIAFGVLIGILFFFLARLILPYNSFGSEEKIGLIGKYHPDDLPDFILADIGRGLTLIDQEGNVVPDIASSWETTDKGKTWIFNLKEDIFWQDKTPIVSSDITYDFSDVEIERPDSQTLIFKLQEEYIPFPSVVSKPVFKKGLLGAGDWKVENLKVNGSFTEELKLVNTINQKKYYKFYPTSERLILAYKMGRIDKILNLFDKKPFDSWETSTITESVNQKQVVTLFFNNKDKLLSEKNVRQALNYALDKDVMGERALGPIKPKSWAYNPQVKKYNFDKEKAKKLIEELSPEQKKDLKITLITTPLLLELGEEISKEWNDIGLKTNVLVTSVIPNQFQAFLTILDIPNDPDQYSLWHSTQQSSNVSHYGSPRIDKLLEDGRKTINSEDRRKIYIDFQRFLLEDLPAAFLYHPKYYTVVRK